MHDPAKDESKQLSGHLAIEKELRENREKFVKAFQTSIDMMAICTLDTITYIDVNDSFIDSLGYERDEIIGRSVEQLEFDLDPSVKKQIMHFLSRDGLVRNVEVNLRKKNGDRIFGIFSASVINLPENRLLLTVMKDITDRKQSEDLVRIQRDLSIVAAQSSDLDHILGQLLATALQMKGVDSGAVYLRNPSTGALDMVTHRGLPEDFIKSSSHFEKDAPQAMLVVKGLPIHTFHRNIGFDLDDVRRKEALRAISVIPIIHENTVVGALNLASHTVDEFPSVSRNSIEAIAGIMGGAISRAQTELLFRESEERCRMIIDRITDVIWKIDIDGNVVFITPSISRLLGYTTDEIKSMNLATILDKESLEAHKSLLADLVQNRDFGTRTVELCYTTKNGLKKPCEVTLSLAPSTSGLPSGLIGVTRDISERKAIEAQMRQSDKMRAVGQLAGGIAHDFNNQLTGIMGFADMLRMGVKNDPTLTLCAENIIQGVKRAADLTSQLLAFARIGTPVTESVDIHKIIFEVVSLLHHTIDKKIAVKQHLNARTYVTTGDSSQLQNALLNLAINARDAMPDGGELVFISENVHLDKKFCQKSNCDIHPGDYIQICVTDTGIGIPEHVLPHIFEPFFTTKDRGKGTGMGLATVYGTIKSHKGAIELSSTIGQGTTFKLFLPLTRNHTDTPARTTHEPHPVKGTARILLIDDEEPIRKMATLMLEDLGYRITVCTNGKEGIDYYTREWKSTDLVLLDMIMPEINGKEAYYAMRKINPDIKVLLSSGYSANKDILAILNLGKSGFIKKPYRMVELTQKIAEILNT